MSPNPIIQLENLEKDYILGEVVVHVLRGITLEIYPSEFVAIMGASGSGKSTLMNIIGCLDHPTRGRYILNGEDVSNLSKNALAKIRNRTIGFVFQNFNLLPSLTSLENVGLPLLYAGVNKKQRDEISASLLKKLGLGDRMKYFPTQLSGGQQQRVAIARALSNNPKIILADEPTGNLDSQSSEEVMQMLKKLHEEEKRTIILVTHDPNVASHADRIIHIKDGKILGDGVK
jgi:putative ABC transport system ATP-binding protein